MLFIFLVLSTTFILVEAGILGKEKCGVGHILDVYSIFGEKYSKIVEVEFFMIFLFCLFCDFEVIYVLLCVQF